MPRFPGFKSQTLSEYSITAPKFDIRTHLSGPLISEGMIYGPMGSVVSRFVAEMHGSWDGAKGILTEDFSYSSGNTQHRQWSLTEGNDGMITATAPDIIGKGFGSASGCAFKMTYRIKLPQESGSHVLNVVDWMYLMENGSILNRSQMRKFGIKVAELVATIRPSK